jgi:hypothetical protein
MPSTIENAFNKCQSPTSLTNQATDTSTTSTKPNYPSAEESRSCTSTAGSGPKLELNRETATDGSIIDLGDKLENP